MGELTAVVHSVESFGLVDGPGVRFVSFLQGCRMRCRYCHNPDTWAGKGTVLGTFTPERLLKTALRYRPYWKENGGITVSGGEPLLQIDFLIEYFKLAKEEGITTVLDSSGNPFTREEPFISKFNELLKYTDLIMLDIKHMDAKKHLELTQCDNANILDMAKYLSEVGQPVWIRHVLVPGWTDSEEHLKELAAFVKTLGNVKKFEVLPYHTLGLFKWQSLGIPYGLEGVNPPTDEEVKRANEILGTAEYGN